MKLENAKYVKEEKLPDEPAEILVEIDGVPSWVPQVEGNRHYDEIMKRVKEGTLTIKDAD